MGFIVNYYKHTIIYKNNNHIKIILFVVWKSTWTQNEVLVGHLVWITSLAYIPATK